MILPDLKQVLEYKNPAVLKLYEQNHAGNKLSAEQAFVELLKYLWVSRKHFIESQCDADPVGFGFCRSDNRVVPIEHFMPDSMREIDDMWHEFILFTADYTEFCLKYFGQYIHHKPVLAEDSAALPRVLVEREVETLITYIYENLGEDTLRVWYSSYLDLVPSPGLELNQNLALPGLAC